MCVRTRFLVLLLLLGISSWCSKARSNPPVLPLDSFTDLEFMAVGRDSTWSYKGVVRVSNQGNSVGVESAQLAESFTHSEPVEFHFSALSIQVEEYFHSRFVRRLLFNKGSAYQSDGASFQCIHPQDVPPFAEISHSLEFAKHVNSKLVKSNIAENCPLQDGLFFRIVFAGESYLLCINQTTGKAISLIGQEFVAKFSKAQSTSMPQLTMPLITCPPSTYRNRMKSAVSPQQTFDDKWWQKHVDKTFASADRRPCIFIHGSGERGFGLVTSTFTSYWGDVNSYATQCSVFKFLHMETVMLGWDSPLLHQNVCDVATFDQPEGDKFLIKNKIIFAHSMGNLILAAAIYDRVCGIDNSTSWYSVNKPSNGSVVADRLISVCANPGIEKEIAVLDGVCVDEKPGQAYYTLRPSYPGLVNLYPILGSRITGGMCGTSATGITSEYSAALALIAQLGKLQSPNDGLVWYNSCFIPIHGVTPGQQPTDLWYTATVNHADGTCRNGNGWWGDDRKPCSWYSNKL